MGMDNNTKSDLFIGVSKRNDKNRPGPYSKLKSSYSLFNIY
jgi:hypothetical protein